MSTYTPNRRQFLSTAVLGSIAVRTQADQPTARPLAGSDFLALGQTINGYPLRYLDSAATTLRPKAVIDAMNQYPAVGARVDGTDLVYTNYQDIGIAIGAGKGLIVPVLRNVFSQARLIELQP